MTDENEIIMKNWVFLPVFDDIGADSKLTGMMPTNL